jgi:flagella basal body P-ring formation protein FlgA
MRAVAVALLLIAAPALGDAAGQGSAVSAIRTIRPGEVIASGDIRVSPSDAAGVLASADEAVGMAARRLLPAGRALRPGDVGPPALVHRNSLVLLVYARGSLAIRTEGRALGDGAEGERVRVMNLASRQTVTGTVMADGTVAMGEVE